MLKDVSGCGEILDSFSWLIDSYVLDFFTEDLWGKLPSNWRTVLEDLEPHELGLWLDQTKSPKYRTPWPLSLLALRSAIFELSLPRKKHDLRQTQRNYDSNNGSSETKAEAFKCSKNTLSDFVTPSNNLNEITEEITHDHIGCKHFDISFNGANDSIHHQRRFTYAFQKHVKPKKRHEIFHMAKVVCELAAKCEVSSVVDVGAGLGHLGRLLSYGHGLSTCCIESQRNLSSSARKLDEELEYTLSKYLSGEENHHFLSPVHITNSLNTEINPSQFLKLVTDAFSEKKCNERGGFGIVGLHPCGDLAVTLLRLFADCVEARFICIAGCCYMKLTPGWGFPISQHILKLSMEKKDLQLSYEAREMACHAIEVYSRKLLSNNHSYLKIHCYRAALEAIIANNWPHLRHSGLRSIKYSEGLQFSEYAKLALSPLELTPPEEDLQSSTTTENLQKWFHVVILYSLRLMFAPLVESFLLYDRLLYLMEKGYPCKVSPEFDPEISPRNHLLIASKPLNELKE